MPSLTGLNSKALKQGDPEPALLPADHARVYSMRFCPWAQRAVIYLASKNIPCEVVNIDLQDKPEWYFSKHPQGKVPALELDGKVVIESGLIPEYLDDVLPETRVLPKCAFAKYQQKLLVDQLSAVAPAFYGLFTALKGDGSAVEEKGAAAVKAIEQAEDLLKTPFFGGESAGYADYLSFPFFERMWLVSHQEGAPFQADNFPGPQYPTLTAWFAAMQKLPEVMASTQPVGTYAKFFESYASGKPDYDVDA